jgi:hypothetical protein
MDYKNISLIRLIEEDIETIYSSLLEKNDRLKNRVHNFDCDTELLAHLYDEKQGVKKATLDNQAEKAGFFELLLEDLKLTKELIKKITNYFDDRDGTTTDINEIL